MSLQRQSLRRQHFASANMPDDPLAMYLEDVFTLPANLAGIPGLSFPVGFDTKGLPIGIQLMGPAFSEDLLLKIGHAYQQVTNHHLKIPALLISKSETAIKGQRIMKWQKP